MTIRRRCLLGALLGWCLLSAAGAKEPPAGASPAATNVIVRSDGADIHSGPLFMRVTALADDVLRVRAAAAADLPEDASWAVSEEARGRSIPVSVKQRYRRCRVSDRSIGGAGRTLAAAVDRVGFGGPRDLDRCPDPRS